MYKILICVLDLPFWLIDRMPKSLCNHELFVFVIVIIVVVIIICDQLNQLIWLSLKTKDLLLKTKDGLLKTADVYC